MTVQLTPDNDRTPGLPAWAYKAILEDLHEGVIITSLDGSFRRMNQAAAKLYGYDDPHDFERHLPKLSTIFELRTYPGRRLIPYRDWPISRLKQGTEHTNAIIYLKRRDTKHELILQYDGRVIKNPEDGSRYAFLTVSDLTQQVHDREATKQSQERLKLAQKAARIGTFEWQVTTGEMLWSEEMELLYGLTPGSFGGHFSNWQELVDPNDTERLDRLVKHAFKHHQRHFETEWRIILPDKSKRSIFAKAEIHYDTEARPLSMIGINMDITQRRNAAEAYKASVDRQSAFFKTALDAIITIDQTGAITEFNPAAERIFKYKRSEALGRDMAELIIPDAAQRKAHHKGMAQYLKTGSGPLLDKQIEAIAHGSDGREFPAELFITRIGDQDPPVFMGTLRDITERKRAEQALRESEQRFRFMAESMPQKIFTANPDGSIDYLNPQWMEYIGLDFEEIMRTGWREFIHPDDIKNVRDRWWSAINNGELYQTEQRIRNKAGEYRWYLTRAHAMHDEAGNVIKWIGSNTDIEDVKRKQELEERTALLTEQHEQLMMINRAKDEFISLASHQLRTPATGVKQYIGMLMQGYFGDLTKEQLAVVTSAYEGNERQLSIINALLNVARLDAGKVTLRASSCNMTELLDEIVQEQTPTFEKRQQRLEVHTPSKPVLCRADSQLIRMVLENIVDNAGKYSPAKKTITVRLRQTKSATIVEVKDQGVGMRAADQSKLFQKFSRIDNELSSFASGSGLGLYWAKKIMDLHQGTISVESRPKRGSTFTIKLPMNTES